MICKLLYMYTFECFKLMSIVRNDINVDMVPIEKNMTINASQSLRIKDMLGNETLKHRGKFYQKWSL